MTTAHAHIAMSMLKTYTAQPYIKTFHLWELMEWQVLHLRLDNMDQKKKKKKKKKANTASSSITTDSSNFNTQKNVS